MSSPSEPKTSMSARRGRKAGGEEDVEVVDGASDIDSPVRQVAPAETRKGPKTMQAEEEMTPYPQASVQRMDLRPMYCIMFTLVILAAFSIATFTLVVSPNCINTETFERVTQVLPAPDATPTDTSMSFASTKGWGGINVCNAKKPDLKNVECIEEEIDEQSAVDVTEGVVGDKETDAQPITTSYWRSGLCPVNVHWHLGTEHRSEGQYDEGGLGPDPALQWEGKGRMGSRCYHYSSDDAKFTTPYEWKHCKHMHVGETYEVHWPHSAAGACGTPNQYQTPFYDGVFCIDGVITSTSLQIGVQAQVFTVVNDERFYYPDLIEGMIVDGDRASDVAFYTGSTTGDTRSNSVCSQYTPITWQVDRKCHLISASSFDKMCADMKSKRDDMSSDLHPHGSRELVAREFHANNVVSGSMVDGRVKMDQP